MTTEAQPLIESAPIPRYVHHLNAFAERLGLTTSLRVAPRNSLPENFWCNDADADQWLGDWCGTRDQILALPGIVPSYHLPQTSGLLLVPTSSYYKTALLAGYVTVDADRVSYAVQFGPVPLHLEERGPIQIITHEQTVLYHGTREALIGSGLALDAQLPSKRDHRSSRGGDYSYDGDKGFVANPSPIWHSRRQPDGSIVLSVESERARLDRIAYWRAYTAERRAHAPWMFGPGPASGLQPAATVRPTHLRLIVDNTTAP